ncbi:uncharacterized protein DFL_005846 [Arthrobotrys flagrans]|uniref:Uncharacterized protein n=1 Tax=Arthrobotrys flagrans TaxID=97331 RepID=A0A436ZYH6_ARTFL|nr:hypothetical protein DFL_005846 [Arthrobotrys flagrans]
MDTTSPSRYPTAQPSSSSDNQSSPLNAQQYYQDEALEPQTQTTWMNHQSDTSAGKSTGEKVLDNSIKAANWLIWGDVGGKEERERKKREKKEGRKKKKEGKDDEMKKKKEGKDDELKKKKRDDDGVEDDWVMEILQALA